MSIDGKVELQVDALDFLLLMKFDEASEGKQDEGFSLAVTHLTHFFVDCLRKNEQWIPLRQTLKLNMQDQTFASNIQLVCSRDAASRVAIVQSILDSKALGDDPTTKKCLSFTLRKFRTLPITVDALRRTISQQKAFSDSHQGGAPAEARAPRGGGGAAGAGAAPLPPPSRASIFQPNGARGPAESHPLKKFRSENFQSLLLLPTDVRGVHQAVAKDYRRAVARFVKKDVAQDVAWDVAQIEVQEEIIKLSVNRVGPYMAALIVEVANYARGDLEMVESHVKEWLGHTAFADTMEVLFGTLERKEAFKLFFLAQPQGKDHKAYYDLFAKVHSAHKTTKDKKAGPGAAAAAAVKTRAPRVSSQDGGGAAGAGKVTKPLPTPPRRPHGAAAAAAETRAPRVSSQDGGGGARVGM